MVRVVRTSPLHTSKLLAKGQPYYALLIIHFAEYRLHCPVLVYAVFGPCGSSPWSVLLQRGLACLLQFLHPRCPSRRPLNIEVSNQ